MFSEVPRILLSEVEFGYVIPVDLQELGDGSFSVPATWGRMQMGSHGLNRILTGFFLLGPARARPGPSKTHYFKVF